MSSASQDTRTVEEKRRRLLALLLEQDGAGLTQTARIRRRQSASPPPLSFAQQRLWFLDQLVPGSPFYNVPAAIRIRAPLNVDALKAALDEIVRRHEVLRTSFGELDGKPFQVVSPPLSVPFEVRDLRHLYAGERERAAVRLATEDARGPFDLRRGPLIRASLLRLGEQDYVFLINIHHIAADGWSMGVLVEEFQQVYGALAQGRPSPLPELAIQYADFAVWQQNRLAAGELQPQLRYWAEKLANLPLLELPTDFPRRDVQGFDGETLYITFPARLSAQLRDFSQRNKVTLFATLLAAFNALLYRYTGQDEIVIGEPVANRNRVELEPLIGFFVNSLVLRTDVSGDPTFRELLRRSWQVVLEADANQDVPFEVLVERLRPERTMGRNPLFQVSLQFFSGARAHTHSATLPSETINVEKGTASLDLAFDLINSEQGILARVEYSTELFRGETVRRMVAHYQNLLESFAANPELRLSEARMLSDDELRQVLRGQSRPASGAKPFAHVHELFEAQALRSPERVAVECGGRRLTYRELNEEANRLARVLQAEGVGPEKIVAVCLDRSVEAVVAVLAVWKAGGAYTPLAPDLPEDRFRFVLSDAKPHLIVAAPGFAGRVPGGATPLVLTDDERLKGAAAENVAAAGGPENLAYVIYTSGSSGTPKGVMVEHGAISEHLRWMQDEFPLGAEDRTLFKYAFSFDVSILEMFQPLLAGASLLVIDGDGPLEISRLAKAIRDHAVTVIDVVPSMLAALLDSPQFTAGGSLRRVICGGEVMPPDLLNRLLGRLGVEFVNMYGPTEAIITATYWRTSSPADSVPIGRPAAPYTAYVLDRDLNPVPPGVPGELYLGGDCLARGYLGRPELTRERFIRDPFSDRASARLYRTGDRCRRAADGNLEFLGRMDEQVKVRGFRIELGEVEAVLATSPLVKSCAAAVLSQGAQAQLAAYVVPNLGRPELWPSLGEYFVYDELLYHAMTADRVRARAYRAAIERTVRGKSVVDIGTGGDLALARMCLEAGARRVYALEMLDEAYEQASRLARELGYADRLVMIRGEARKIELPEKVDVCVSELIGAIGSSEGVIEILNDARRFLRPGGGMIPHRCVTRIAAVSLPDELVERPEFGELPRHYAEKVFAGLGRRFDIRVCVKNLPASCVVSDAAVFEELSFDRPGEPEQSTEFSLTIRRDCRVDGFLLWVALHAGSEELIDVLTSECHWLPVFFPAFSPGVRMRAGDTIAAAASRLVEPGDLTPDYLVRGAAAREGEPPLDFSYESRRNRQAYRSNPFYRSLHDALESAEAKPARAEEERTRVREWREIYEQIYAAGEEARDKDFDIVGWNSTYTGQPLSREEMLEQVEATAARVAALGGRRVLEIGCGTGLLLLRLAGGCDRYVGTDFSGGVIEQVGQAVRERGWRQVELWERAADDFEGVEPGSFDVVVLNSVAQYFPGVDYLVRVIEGACRALRPGGHLFVGDVRSLPLLRLLHAGIELERAGPKTSAAQLRERLERRLRQEQELVIDPDFFRALIGCLGGITGASVQVKRGWRHNELTRFRYDAVLQTGGPARPLEGHAELEWERLGSVEALGEYLRGASPRLLLVRGVPGARLGAERRKLEEVERADPEATLGSLGLDELVAPVGVEPEQLWALETDLPYEVQINWAERGDAGSYDLLCVARAGRAGGPTVWATGRPDARPWNAYANAQLRQPTQQHLERALRQHAGRKLPDYMVPSTFVWMDALPLTPSGKLNRRALPAPDASRASPDDVYAPPETEMHRQVAAAWSEVLGIEKIGIDSSFFNVGGHSLLAMQVVSRLSDSLQLDIPLRLMFERPTIRGFAEAAEGLRAGAGERQAPRPIPVRPKAEPGLNLEQLTDEQVTALINGLLVKDGTS